MNYEWHSSQKELQIHSHSWNAMNFLFCVSKPLFLHQQYFEIENGDILLFLCCMVIKCGCRHRTNIIFDSNHHFHCCWCCWMYCFEMCPRTITGRKTIWKHISFSIVHVSFCRPHHAFHIWMSLSDNKLWNFFFLVSFRFASFYSSTKGEFVAFGAYILHSSVLTIYFFIGFHICRILLKTLEHSQLRLSQLTYMLAVQTLYKYQS